MLNQHSNAEPRTPFEIAERRKLVVKLRIKGWTYQRIRDEIIPQIGYSVTVACVCQDFLLCMRESAKEFKENTAALRDTAIMRYDVMLAAIWERVEQGSLDHIEMALKIEAQRAKLLGLNKETKEKDSGAPQRLPQAELEARLRNIMNRLGGAAPRALSAAPETVDAELVSEQSGVQVEPDVTNE